MPGGQIDGGLVPVAGICCDNERLHEFSIGRAQSLDHDRCHAPDQGREHDDPHEHQRDFRSLAAPTPPGLVET